MFSHRPFDKPTRERPFSTKNKGKVGSFAAIASLVASFVLVVSVVTGNEVAKATSVLTWSSTTTISNHVGSDLEYGNGKFVLLGGQDPNKRGEVGGVRISSNGTTWTTPTTPPTDRDWRFAAYGNGTWIIAAPGMSTGWIAKSTDDGATWTETNLSTSINRINTLEFLNGKFIMGGLSLPSWYQDIFTSTNGTTWASTGYISCYNQSGGCDGASFTNPAYGISYANGRYVVVAMTSMATSTDLVNWNSIAVPANFYALYITANAGKFLVNDQWSSNVLISTDGTTFPLSAGTDRVARTRVFGNEWFGVDVNFNSKLYRSTDGITWTTSFMDNDPDNDPNTDTLQDRFIGLASNGVDIVAATEGPFSPVGARTIKTTLPPAISPSTQTISGTAGTAITSSTALSANFFQGAVTYAVSSGTLPAGLSLNTTTGVISGTPSASSSATITVTGTGATSGTATTSVTFAIVAAPTTTTTTTTTVPASSGSSVAPTLVTSSNQAALEADPGEAVAIINGQTVAVETVKVESDATPTAMLEAAKEIVSEITKLLPAGTTNDIKVVKTDQGAELTRLMINPEDPTEKLNVPVESVTLVKAGSSAVLISALNQTNLPAEVVAGGEIQVTRGGLVAARAYGLPGSESGEIVLMSTPRLLQKFTVSANGTYNGQVPLPKDIAFGSHTVVMATANAKVSLGIKLVRTRMQFRIKRTIATTIFKNRAGVKKAGGKVTITGAGRCKATSSKVTMSSKAGACYITVKQAAKGTYPAVFYRFTVQVVKKLIKKK